MKRFLHVDVSSIQEASNYLKKGNAYLIAGGTDIIGTLKDAILPDDLYPDLIVNIKTIPGLDYIKEDGGFLKIGALTKLDTIANNEIIRSKYSCLAEAAEKTASIHLREMGTIGGNICQMNRCWYFRNPENKFSDCVRKGGKSCYALSGDNRYHSIFGMLKACAAVNPSDTAPAIVVLNGIIVTDRREIAANDFWASGVPQSTVLSSDEIVTEIKIPTPVSGTKSSFLKFAIRKTIDFPIVNCASAVSANDTRICLNAVYNRPVLCTSAADIVKGKPITEALAKQAGEEAVRKCTTFDANGNNPGNKYKVQIAKTLIMRTLLNCK